jgi:glutamate-1-semialdehyde 2,1-aminomutase
VATAAGLATLRILKRPGTYERMRGIGTRLMAGLQRLCDDRRIPARVVGEPVLFDVFFTDEEIVDYRSTLRADRDRLARFVRLLRAEGIFRGYSKFYLSIVHDEQDVEETLKAFEITLDALPD